MSRKAKPVPLLARHHARPPLPATDPRTRERIAAWWGPNLVANAERKMRDVLVAAGMPTTPYYAFDLPNGRGGWRDLPRFALTQGHGVGSEVWYAAKIIEQIADTRDAMARGNHDQILHNALHLGALMKEANTQVALGVTLGQVENFETGRHKPRRDQLARLIDQALNRLGKNAPYDIVLRHIERLVEVDWDERLIFWGGGKSTTFKSFQNRLTTRRKLFHKPKK
jgi:hypothetical protein